MKIAIDINDVLRDNMYQFRSIFQKFVDSKFDIELDEINSYNMMEVYPFRSEDELYQFRYVDYPFELYALAGLCENKAITYMFNDWCEKTLMNLDDENIPEVILFSPFEIGITIPSTYSFLASHGVRTRGIIFPKDSMKIYDTADIVVTAQPSLITGCPEGKYVFKINKPYNKECESVYSYDSLIGVMKDDDNKLINILENKENGNE